MISELEIVIGCKKSDIKAQTLLYRTFAPKLKVVCFRYVKNNDLVKDIVQDAFIKIFKNIGKYESKGSLEGWMKRIVINSSLDYLKSNSAKNSVDIDDIDLVEENTDDENVINEIIERGFDKVKLLSFLNELDEKYSIPFNLYYIDEVPYSEMSKILNTSENNSRKLVFRAKNALKIKLLTHFNIESTIYGK